VRFTFWHVWDFAVHAIVGTIIFAIIAVPAVGIDIGVRHLEPRFHTSAIIMVGLRAGEIALLAGVS
jgi:hypothetical protein